MNDSRASVVSPGNHDGVHLGHRALLDAARDLAGDLAGDDVGDGGPAVTALTFDPHPAQVLAPDRAPPLLTTLERRRVLLKAFGADAVETLRFDRALAEESPETFVTTVLVERLGARGVVVGPDFRFGKGRGGDVETLRALGRVHGFEVREVDPVRIDGAVVSSTRVRAALALGDVEGAARLLGRVHDVGGEVIHGDHRGRTIGFPTANLRCEPVLLPSDGVYAVVAREASTGALLRGVANLGVRPTMDAGRSVEAHFFDFAGDLYAQSLRLGFVARLRGERKFDGLDALKAQIARDAADARASLDAADPASWALV